MRFLGWGFWIFLFYIAGVLLVSVLPINGPELHINDIYLIDIRLDYLLHALIFIPYIPLSLFSKVKFKNIFFLILTSILLAIISESIQYILPYRTYNINDLLANTLGITLGTPTLLFYNPTKKNNPK